jgi:hypothetical protein
VQHDFMRHRAASLFRRSARQGDLLEVVAGARLEVREHRHQQTPEASAGMAPAAPALPACG